MSTSPSVRSGAGGRIGARPSVRARLAQLVEQGTLNPLVTGSSPVAGITISRPERPFGGNFGGNCPARRAVPRGSVVWGPLSTAPTGCAVATAAALEATGPSNDLGSRVTRFRGRRVLALCMAPTSTLVRDSDGLVGDVPPMAEPPLLISIPEAARLLSCSSGLVKLMIRRGQLRPVKLGRLTRISRAQLTEKFLTEQGISACTTPLAMLQFCGSPPLPTARRVGALRRKRHG